MLRRNVKAIVAIGNQGQIGLDGQLPWHNPKDLAWFKSMTSSGGVLIAGHNTFHTLPELPNRHVMIDCDELFRRVLAKDVNYWIIGGAKTYAKWAPYIDQWYISKIDYDGPADTYFNKDWLFK